jgi:hypothetical protein
VETNWICEGRFFEPRATVIALQPPVAATAACAGLSPPSPLAIEIADGAVTVSPTVTLGLVQGAGGEWGDRADVWIDFSANWGAVGVTGRYMLTLTASTVSGVVDVAWGDCTDRLDLTTALCPLDVEACGVADDGWNLQCQDGVVRADDLTRYQFCATGGTEPVCAVGGAGDPYTVATCTGACLDGEVRWIETYEEYAAFDPTALCAP